jgi:adenylate cyclase
VDVELGDQVQQEMSALFSDIRGFTNLSESMSPEDNFKFINAYLSRMEPAIISNHGFIDKYIGDAIMALFDRGADNAIKSGINMLNTLAEYNTTRTKPDRPPIKIGIGIHSGMLMLGTVGSVYRMEGTVISSALNVAYCLEELTKIYGVSFLISGDTYNRLKNPKDYQIRPIDSVKMKGRSQQVAVFEVFDADPPDVKEGKLSTQAVFEQGVTLYHQQSFKESASFLEICLDLNPSDKVSQIYWERCQKKLKIES